MSRPAVARLDLLPGQDEILAGGARQYRVHDRQVAQQLLHRLVDVLAGAHQRQVVRMLEEEQGA
ncbi:hypothetical protein [Nonomuraea sp. NPDC049480]|uniref:hypothetical protein n=1 Tax=Nonomuraea sp. NPDC049480 TaxID=3364353 RepID=UPI0037968572